MIIKWNCHFEEIGALKIMVGVRVYLLVHEVPLLSPEIPMANGDYPLAAS